MLGVWSGLNLLPSRGSLSGTQGCCCQKMRKLYSSEIMQKLIKSVAGDDRKQTVDVRDTAEIKRAQ